MLVNKLSAVGASIALMALSLAPAAFANTDIQVSGNGRGSDNSVFVSSQTSNSLTQSNNSEFNNNVVTNANTGNNSADDNNGSSTTVQSGDVWTNVQVHNMAGMNVANVGNGCGCTTGDTSVSVNDNGRNSENTVGVSSDQTNRMNQTNNANFNNNVETNGNTGGNASQDNGGDNNMWWMNHNWDNMNGNNWWMNNNWMNWSNNNANSGGSSTVKSGSVDTNVSIMNQANSNQVN